MQCSPQYLRSVCRLLSLVVDGRGPELPSPVSAHGVGRKHPFSKLAGNQAPSENEARAMAQLADLCFQETFQTLRVGLVGETPHTERYFKKENCLIGGRECWKCHSEEL